jgi:carboxyl-terminal processing protease
MMRKVVVAGLLAGILGSPAALPAAAKEAAGDPNRHLAAFAEVFEEIRSRYVDEVDEGDLIRAAIDGMMRSLDPHSAYLPPEDFAALRNQTRGAFGGVGVEVSDEEGRVRIVNTTSGAPADRAGLRPGDIITHLDGEPTEGLSLREASERIRGEVGTTVTMTVVRDGADAPLVVVVTRETINIRAVRSSLEDGVVVIKLTAFNEQTHRMLREQFAERVGEAGSLDQVAGVILDLRDNRGGLLDQAVQVSDSFLDSGEIVSTRGRDPRRTARYTARSGDLAAGKPVVVLINGRSASASEIVAGALQDNARALILGTQSFGKGSVQTIMALPREGAMKVTTSLYFTPSGRSIQALGIAPDILVEQPEPLGEGTNLAEAEDYQLRYAIDVVRGLSLIARDRHPERQGS